MNQTDSRISFALALAAATVIAIVIAGAVGFAVRDPAAILLAIGLTPIGWTLTATAFEIRRGTPACRAVTRSIPMVLLGSLFCLFFVAYAVGWIGE